MPTAYYMVHYRRFEAGAANLNGATIETLCRSSLDVADSANVKLWERAQDRLFDVGDSDGRQILLNKVADLSSAVFGEMCLVQSSDLQALLELKPSKVQLSDLTMAEIFNLGERSAPTGSQFVRGMAYWLAIGNHIFFVKTHSMSAEYLHAYLNWLVKIRTQTLDPSISFTLQAEFDQATVSGDIGDIRSLQVKGKAAPQISVSAPQQADGADRVVKTARTVADKLVQFGQAVPIVEALFGKAKADSLVASLGVGEYLAVDASVKVRGKRTTESRVKLRELANDLADLTDAEVRVEGKDGKMSDGDAILRTRMPFNLPHEGSNLLEFDHVADQLQEVYTRFVKDGKIKA
jgi:hypothetical protein